jgi:capsular polysaccharide biosynthesis protein
VLSLLAGAGYAALSPPLLASNTLSCYRVSTHDTAAQVGIARSNVVLASALPKVRPAMSLQALSNDIVVKRMTANIILVDAQGKTVGKAEGTANAVTNSYVAYVSPGEVPVQAQLLESATIATETPLFHRLLITAGSVPCLVR